MDKPHDKARLAIESGEEKFRDAAEYLAEAQKLGASRGNGTPQGRRREIPNRSDRGRRGRRRGRWRAPAPCRERQRSSPS